MDYSLDVFTALKLEEKQNMDEYINKAVKAFIDTSKIEAKENGRVWNRHNDITMFNTFAHVFAYIKTHPINHRYVTDEGSELIEHKYFFLLCEALFKEATK